jgi:hypothetical protein
MDKEIEKQGIIDYWTWRKEKDIIEAAKQENKLDEQAK